MTGADRHSVCGLACKFPYLPADADPWRRELLAKLGISELLSLGKLSQPQGRVGEVHGLLSGEAAAAMSLTSSCALQTGTLLPLSSRSSRSGFAVLWFAGGGQIGAQSRSSVKGVSAGVASGIGSMIAHSGGPPVAMYLLPLGLSKSEYAGTTFVFFIVGNLLKAGPWLALVELDRQFWTLLMITLPVIVLGVWSGWRLHDRLDQVQLYRACYALLIVVTLKLLWDGARGYALL